MLSLPQASLPHSDRVTMVRLMLMLWFLLVKEETPLNVNGLSGGDKFQTAESDLRLRLKVKPDSNSWLLKHKRKHMKVENTHSFYASTVSIALALLSSK
ncbi:hypothetical protein YC2023_074455 [Brassica napus]